MIPSSHSPNFEEQENFLAWKRMADEGFADAQLRTGLCYEEGNGVKRSYESAFHYYKLAADQGYTAAQVLLGLLYEEGLGIEQSYNQAIRYYKLAAKNGSASAQVQLGKLYAEGKGVGKSPVKAVECYQKAANQGLPSAWAYLAEAYEKGIGVEKSEKKAQMFRQKRFQHKKEEADAGDASSQAAVGYLFETGEGVEKSPEQAFHYYKLAAEQNFLRAFFHLAECFAEGKGTLKSVENAIQYYKLAAHQGYLLAQASLGRFLLKHKIDEEKAVEYLKAVIQKGFGDPELVASCEYNLGECFENGKGVKQSNQNALYYYKLAADHGDEIAQGRLGDVYLKGKLGVQKAPHQAIHYYELAAKQGLSSALEMLGICYETGEGIQQSNEKAFQHYKMAADIDMKKGYSSSIFLLARCYELGIGTEKSLETATYYYKFAAENGFTTGYSKVAQCYRELGGKENEEKADAYYKLATKGETEEKIIEMKNHHDFSSTKKDTTEEKISHVQNILSNSQSNSSPQVKLHSTHDLAISQKPFFIIDKESLKHLEEGKEDAELVLNMTKGHINVEEMSKALEEQRIGLLEETKNGGANCKFPERYASLIEQRRAEGKLKRIILIKEDGKHIINLSQEKEPSREEPAICATQDTKATSEERKYQQVICEISKYFPDVQGNDIALLMYLDKDIVNLGLSGINRRKNGIQLHHLTPWNIDKETINDIISSGRLAAYVLSKNGHNALYLTENAKKSLRDRNVIVAVFPYYASKEQLDKLFPGDDTPPENACKIIEREEFKTFSQEQYACAHKLSLVVLTSQLQLGGKNNILLGGMFIHSNKHIKIHKIATLSGEISDNSPTHYFYLSKNGLNRLGVNSRIIQLEMITNRIIHSEEEWQKIIEESRLVCLIQGKDGKKQLLMHQKILEDRPQWKELINKSPVTPLAIEHDGKFILYQPDISLALMNQETYDRIINQVGPI